jgi:tetraacyldisaccharide 4'-kinase
LVTGISNPSPLKLWIEHQTAYYRQMQFRDHHIFTADDLKDIQEEFKKLTPGKGIVLTTEKDAVRLEKFEKSIQCLPFCVVPVRHEIMFNEKEKFERAVTDFIENFQKQN